ncbi:MAG: hypothetical protein HZA48_12775 [Planctomycetes bacterium]|nr:hypothetical protein [Planctomycetota bacterium]
MPRSTGIQFDGEYARIVELEGNSRKFKARFFRQKTTPFVSQPEVSKPESTAPLPAETPVQTVTQKPAGTLAELFRSENISKDQVITAVDSSNAIIRTLTIPLTNPDQIRRAIKFEFENFIHNIPVDGLVIDFYRISEEKSSSRLITFGISKNVVASHIETLETADINPVYVELDITAFFNAFSFSRQYKENPSCVLVLIENKFAKIIVVNEGIIAAVRIVRFEVTSGNAAALCKHVESTVFSADIASGPACVFMADAGAQNTGLTAQMQELLGMPVKELTVEPPAEFLDGNGQEFNIPPDMAVPYGLALKGLDYDKSGLDLRQEQYKYQKRFDLLKKAVAVLLCLTLTLLGLVTISLSGEIKALKTKEDYVRDEQAKLFSKATGSPLPNDSDALAELVKFEDRIKTAVGGGDHPLPVSAMEYCDELFLRIEKAKVSYLLLKTLRVSNSQKQIIMTGEMQQGDIQALTNSLNASDKFKTSLPNYTMTSDNKAAFTYTISLKQKEEHKK